MALAGPQFADHAKFLLETDVGRPLLGTKVPQGEPRTMLENVATLQKALAGGLCLLLVRMPSLRLLCLSYRAAR